MLPSVVGPSRRLVWFPGMVPGDEWLGRDSEEWLGQCKPWPCENWFREGLIEMGESTEEVIAAF